MEKVLVVKQVIRPVENASRQVVIMSKAKADRLEQRGLLGARISNGINSCYTISR